MFAKIVRETLRGYREGGLSRTGLFEVARKPITINTIPLINSAIVEKSKNSPITLEIPAARSIKPTKKMIVPK